MTPRHTLGLLVLAACSDAKLGSADRSPEVTILAPTDGGTFRPGEPFTLCAQVSDEDPVEALSFVVVAGRDGTLHVATGSPGLCEGGNVAIPLTLTGAAQPLTLHATDALGQVGSATVGLSPTQNLAPTCTIDAPTDGASTREGEPLTFRATVADPDHDAATLSFTLASDLDGSVSAGPPPSDGILAWDDLALSVGDHLLTLQVTDPGGRTAACAVDVTVDGCFDDDGDGYLSCEDDCDDTDAGVNPEGVEEPDGTDQDCDGVRDDGTVIVDDDGDGYNELEGDCDDTRADTHPGATERWYDGTDQDCDGRDDDRDADGYGFDEDCDDSDAARSPSEPEVWYDGTDQDCDGDDDDQDADGYPLADDCDDTDANAHPDAEERWYDGVDQDCDDRDDDQDFDGYVLADDCDDTDPSRSPAARETWYDGTDQDCDGRDDDQDSDGYALVDDCDDADPSRNPAERELWYDGTDQDCDGRDDDQDADGYAFVDDCDDTDPASYPGATERWYDGTDQDCDGRDDDQDGDGFRRAFDCDDTSARVYPGATEVWYDGIDQDCDGNDTDRDRDGYAWAIDCDDTDARVNPGAAETWYDGTDQDCDGNDDDRDRDGYGLADDCDDDDPTVNPGATEVWYDGTDQDCDGADDDQDADGYALADDCDDTNAAVHPGATESRNAADDDCDELCDEGLVAAGDLIVTEFLRDPARVSDADGEWFEVYNTTSTDIRMCGWRIGDTGTDTFTMTSDLLVPAGDYAVLGRSSETARNGGATVDYAYGLGMSLGNGAGDEIVIWHDGAEIDRVAYVSGWPLYGGRSTALRPAGYSATGNDSASNWCLSTSTFGAGDKGTPGGPNDPC